MCPLTGVTNIMKSQKFDKIFRLEKVFKKSSLYPQQTVDQSERLLNTKFLTEKAPNCGPCYHFRNE